VHVSHQLSTFLPGPWPALYGLLCLVGACARQNATPDRRPSELAPAAAVSAPGVSTEPVPIQALTDADKPGPARRVRLLGLTEPAKDEPYLEVKGASVVLRGSFDESLWAHRDRLVVLDGVLEWAPLRAVPTTDEHGQAIQTRGQVGGWSLSDIASVRPPTLHDLAGTRAWVEGVAAEGSAVKALEGMVRVKATDPWPATWLGRAVRVEGQIQEGHAGFAVQQDRAFALDLAARTETEVDLAGRCWSLNEQWWFEWHGQRLTIQPSAGLWPPRHLPQGGHGELARITGKLTVAAADQPGKLAIEPTAVRALAAEDLYAASW